MLLICPARGKLLRGAGQYLVTSVRISLRRPPKDSAFWAFGVVLQDAATVFSRCKDTKKIAEMQVFPLLFAHLFVTLQARKI
jgi:hypothetical protein